MTTQKGACQRPTQNSRPHCCNVFEGEPPRTVVFLMMMDTATLRGPRATPGIIISKNGLTRK